MRKSLSLVLSGALLTGLSAQADSIVPIEGIASAMSPDATMVVGTKGTRGDKLYTSFLYTTAEDEVKWLTDGEDYMKSHLEGGRFRAINDAGIIAGTVRNPDMRLQQEVGPYYVKPANMSDDFEGLAISSAAVWRDGKLHVLGCGPYTIDYFADSTDGSTATGISADGNTVFGNIISNWMAIEACVWEYDETTGEYEYRRLDVPRQAQMSSMNTNAAAGYPAIGAMSVAKDDDNMMTALIWKSATEPLTLNIPGSADAYGIYAHAISADGRYVTVTVSSYHPALYLCDLENDSLEEVTLPEGTTETMVYTVDNNGNVIFQMQDSNWEKDFYYYDNASGSIVTLAEYFIDSVEDYDLTTNLKNANVLATSGDGKHILMLENADDSRTWMLNIDNPQLRTCPAPSTLSLYHSSPTTLEVQFRGITNIPDGCTLKGYKVYVNNAEVATIEATETGGTYYASADGATGATHTAHVRTIYTKGGEEKLSGNSPMAAESVHSSLSLIDFIDFNDAVMDEQGNYHWSSGTWTSKTNYGISGQYINWHIGCNDFENRTPALNVVTVADSPWSSVFVSHFMDATDADDFYLDFRYLLRLVNTTDQILTSDWLDVEVTTDGREWTTVGSINAADTPAASWHSCHIDLGKDYAGKVFQLRFNAHGEGQGNLMWMIDDIVVDDGLYGAAPTGLRYAGDEESVKLMWHNGLGMHDLSYLDNSGILWDFNVGSEGAPLIGAIELTRDQTAPFEGEYITAVSSFLYDDPTIPQIAPTTAEAIVYADGKEVARAAFDSDFKTVDQAVAWLDNPVRIEAGKTYRVGVRISNYAAEQAPMYYQASRTCIPGLSDLFSEDEGRTWMNASSALATDLNPEGLCVWPIRAHISPAADTEAADFSELHYFDVFRNGEKVNFSNIYEPHPWVELKAPYEGTYTIQAHYTNGFVSPMSEPLEVKSVSGINEVSFTLGVTAGRGTVAISGDCLGAILYDMQGKTIANTKASTISGLAAGVYILKAETATGIETYKVIVK